eukprot:1504434-Rhodomonas_salina.1
MTQTQRPSDQGTRTQAGNREGIRSWCASKRSFANDTGCVLTRSWEGGEETRLGCAETRGRDAQREQTIAMRHGGQFPDGMEHLLLK